MKNASDYYNKSFAKRIRDLMNDDEHGKKYTQQEVAVAIGTTRQAISQYMDGSVSPNADKLTKLAAFFNVTSDFLLGLSDIRQSDIGYQEINKLTGLSEFSISRLVKMQSSTKLKRELDSSILNLFIEHGYIDQMIALTRVYMKQYLDAPGLESPWRIEQEEEFAKWLFSNKTSDLLQVACENLAPLLSDYFRIEYEKWHTSAHSAEIEFRKAEQNLSSALGVYEQCMSKMNGIGEVIDFPDFEEGGEDNGNP